MVFQDFESQLFSTNVAHEVAFAMEQVGMGRDEMNERMAPALDAVGLRGFEHRDPTSLSGGEKQRLAIASVLALRPRLSCSMSRPPISIPRARRKCSN